MLQAIITKQKKEISIKTTEQGDTMKKVLIAVDDIRSSKSVLSTYYNSVQRPETILLLNVDRKSVV